MQLVRFPMRFTDAYIACWVLREEGGRRPETRRCMGLAPVAGGGSTIFGLFYTTYGIQFYLGIECIVFVGVLLVSMYSVFWSLIPQDAGPEGSS
jgi:hypothetical protein